MNPVFCLQHHQENQRKYGFQGIEFILPLDFKKAQKKITIGLPSQILLDIYCQILKPLRFEISRKCIDEIPNALLGSLNYKALNEDFRAADKQDSFCWSVFSARFNYGNYGAKKKVTTNIGELVVDISKENQNRFFSSFDQFYLILEIADVYYTDSYEVSLAKERAKSIAVTCSTLAPLLDAQIDFQLNDCQKSI
ncbi:hypothetical protein DAMA08_013370 [Martiniozyma asiatica (nom. inval.)]|nr:hypothetical protein DAMA08_013370 [Martiniozyma asiatica]